MIGVEKIIGLQIVVYNEKRLILKKFKDDAFWINYWIASIGITYGNFGKITLS